MSDWKHYAPPQEYDPLQQCHWIVSTWVNTSWHIRSRDRLLKTPAYQDYQDAQLFIKHHS